MRLAVLAGTYQGLEARPTSPVMGTFRTRSCTELIGPLAIITLRKASGRGRCTGWWPVSGRPSPAPARSCL